VERHARYCSCLILRILVFLRMSLLQVLARRIVDRYTCVVQGCQVLPIALSAPSFISPCPLFFSALLHHPHAITVRSISTIASLRRIVASHRISHYYVQAHEPAVPPRLYSSMYFCNSSLSVSLFSCRPSLPSPSYRPTSVYKHLPTIVSPSITDAIIHIMKPSMQSLIMPLIRTKSAGCRSNLVTH
jgi:hypothetical protein